MDLAALDYPLPPSAIAQTPAEPREAARLLVIDRATGALADHVVRELPDLLKNKKNHGKWVAYYGDERIGIAPSDEPLIRECIRRGLRDDEYDLEIIEPHARPPWEPEDIEPGGHEVDDMEDSDQPGAAGATA